MSGRRSRSGQPIRNLGSKEGRRENPTGSGTIDRAHRKGDSRTEPAFFLGGSGRHCRVVVVESDFIGEPGAPRRWKVRFQRAHGAGGERGRIATGGNETFPPRPIRSTTRCGWRSGGAGYSTTMDFTVILLLNDCFSGPGTRGRMEPRGPDDLSGRTPKGLSPRERCFQANVLRSHDPTFGPIPAFIDSCWV